MLSLERWIYLRLQKLDDCESPGIARRRQGEGVKGEDKQQTVLCCAGCGSDTEWTQREQRGGWTYFRFFDKTCLHLLTMCGL